MMTLLAFAFQNQNDFSARKQFDEVSKAFEFLTLGNNGLLCVHSYPLKLNMDNLEAFLQQYMVLLMQAFHVPGLYGDGRGNNFRRVSSRY